MIVLVRFICVFLLISSTTAFFINSEVGKEMEEIVPKEVKTFYESLDEDDRSVLQQVLGKTSQYTNLSEVLTDLRNGSSTLYDKAVGLVTDIRGTVAALSPPARKFVDETVEQIQRPTWLLLVMERWTKKTKKELMDSFPLANSILNNTVFQTLAAGLLGIGASS
ncbi:Fatty-acid and retinol-binding protein 7 [Aphelenchoides besseyi]|nr:Fatty-acid and retinol-binding protein 7 [Aphelenchoides besseyi]